MIEAAAAAGVGPMAAVAGALAARVGLQCGPFKSEVIVENGGDIFLAIPTAGHRGPVCRAAPL